MSSLTENHAALFNHSGRTNPSWGMSPVSLLREAYSRYARRDFAGLLQMFSPEIEITESTELPWGGRFVGCSGAQRFFSLLSLYANVVPEPRVYIPTGGDVAVIGRLKGFARATDRIIDIDVVHLWSVRDGKITRFAAFIDTPAIHAALRAT